MAKFTDVEVSDDGSAVLLDTNNHSWVVKFAGERPIIEQQFPPPEESTDQTPAPESDGETKRGAMIG